MIFRRPRIAEIGFLAAIAVFAAFMLWHAFKLDFVVRGTIGPGLYPALVLGALLATALILVAKAAVSHEIRVLSPFLEGLQHDTMLRRLAARVGEVLSTPVRIVANTGSGRFSAMHAGRNAPPDGGTVAVITSETTDLPNLEAAPFCLDNFDPIARLWFDPDVLIVRANSSWRNLADLFGNDRREAIRVGIAHDLRAAGPVLRWMSRPDGPRIHPEHHPDGKRLLRHLREGRLDVVIMGIAEADDDLGRGGLMPLASLSDEPDETVMPVATATAQGYPMISGRWGGLALPRHTDGHSEKPAPERLYRAFAEASLRLRMSGSAETSRQEAVLSPADFTHFLVGLREQWRRLSGDANRPTLPHGKVEGLLVAALAVLFFPQLMELMGFLLTSFLFLAVLMALLWPKLEARNALTIVPVSAAVSLALYLLFSDLFYVVFPAGRLWGGG